MGQDEEGLVRHLPPAVSVPSHDQVDPNSFQKSAIWHLKLLCTIMLHGKNSNKPLLFSCPSWECMLLGITPHTCLKVTLTMHLPAYDSRHSLACIRLASFTCLNASMRLTPCICLDVQKFPDAKRAGIALAHDENGSGTWKPCRLVLCDAHAQAIFWGSKMWTGPGWACAILCGWKQKEFIAVRRSIRQQDIHRGGRKKHDLV